MRGRQAFGWVVDQPCPRMRKNVFEIYGSKSAVVLRFEADVMDNADADRIGDIALDFDASAGLHFDAHVEIGFSECPVDHCSCGGDGLQQDHRLLRQLFQADLFGGKAHAAARYHQSQLGRNQRNFFEIDERMREQAHRQIGVARAYHRDCIGMAPG